MLEFLEIDCLKDQHKPFLYLQYLDSESDDSDASSSSEDLESKSDSDSGDNPSPTAYHSFVDCEVNSKVILYGGLQLQYAPEYEEDLLGEGEATIVSGEIWEWSHFGHRWKQIFYGAIQ